VPDDLGFVTEAGKLTQIATTKGAENRPLQPEPARAIQAKFEDNSR
jgi:hypothetical protein